MHKYVQPLIDLAKSADPIWMAVTMAGCEPEPEKVFSGTPTVCGELCRLNARLQYLLDLLACETDPGSSDECCDKAYKRYCKAFDACPD